MRFLERGWSDAEKWAMGIVSVLITAGLTAGLVAFFSSSTDGNGIVLSEQDIVLSEQDKIQIALLVGHDFAIALSMSMEGDDITKIRAKINERLELLGIDEGSYPDEPGNGPPVTKYFNEISGILSARSEAQECAFQLGFAGLAKIAQPENFPDFSIRDTAECAGFPDDPNLSDEEYLQNLVEIARGGG